MIDVEARPARLVSASTQDGGVMVKSAPPSRTGNTRRLSIKQTDSHPKLGKKGRQDHEDLDFTEKTEPTERSSSLTCTSFSLEEQLSNDYDNNCGSTSDSSDDLMFASQQDVTRLLHEIHYRMSDKQAKQDEFQEDITQCLELAKGRYASGSVVTTRIALKRRHDARIALGRIAAQQCALLEMYTDVQEEWQQAQSFATNGDLALVDVDVSFYRNALKRIDDAPEWPAFTRSMSELWEELQGILEQGRELAQED